jgi:hypothetical protein
MEVESGQGDLLRSQDLHVGRYVLVSIVKARETTTLTSSCCATPSGGIGAFGGIITKGFGFVSPPHLISRSVLTIRPP